MEVIVMKIVMKEGSAVVAGLIGSGISPFASDGLDEALGLTFGLGAIRSGEEMFEAELAAGGGEVAGAVGRAAIGQEALDGDAMGFEEIDGLMESIENALNLFVWQEAGESEAGMVIDSDVETFDAGAWIANGAIAGGADAGTSEAAQLLDVEVEEFAGVSAFVALGRKGVVASALEPPADGAFADVVGRGDLAQRET